MKKHFWAFFLGITFGLLTFSIMQMISVNNTTNKLKETDNFNKICWSVFSTIIGFSISEYILTKLED